MKKRGFSNMIVAALLIGAVTCGIAFQAEAKTKRNSSNHNKTQVVYTGEIGKKIIGYNGPTPLNITITGGKVTAIEALPNQEGPRYMAKAQEKVFPQFIGKTVDAGIALEADAATGATYTSEALIKNIQLGLKQAKQESGTTKKANSGNTKKKNRRMRRR